MTHGKTFLTLGPSFLNSDAKKLGVEMVFEDRPIYKSVVLILGEGDLAQN